MRRTLTLVGCLLLAGCAAAPREIALAGLDLNDAGVIAEVSKGLSQKERAAFATFALLHWPEAKAYCGRSIFKGASQPRTVGEAIDKTMEFETALTRKRIEEKRPRTVLEQEAQLHQRLVFEFDELTLQRDMLASADLPAAEKQRRAAELTRRLAENRDARNRLTAEPAF